MALNRSFLAVALLAGLIPAAASQAATITVGYTNLQGGGTPIGAPLPSAAAARSAFLTTLSTTYVEDFEDWTVNSTVGNNKSLTLPGYAGGVKVSASNNSNGKTTVTQGVLSNWGDFGGLASATPSTNKWLGVHSSLLTFTFETLVTNVGFLVNDARDLGTGTINVTWADGSSSNLPLATLGSANGNLSNQNLYFVGINNVAGISSISISGASNTDGFALDNLIIGNSAGLPGATPIPLPPAAYAGLALTGLVAGRRYLKNRYA